MDAQEELLKILSESLSKSIDEEVFKGLKISSRKIKIGNIIIKINELSD